MLRLLGKILIGLVVAAALLVGAAAAYRSWLQNEGEQLLTIDSPNGIDEAMFVSVRGEEQWITIRGRDRTNPVLLVVHGGPGAALSPLAAAFLVFEDDYTVVQWDQPGAARTFARAGGTITPGLTVADIAADGVAVAELVSERLAKEKVVLVGLSWGSMIGVEMARARPDLFSAYVGTGLFVNRDDGEAVAYDEVLARARSEGNERAAAELEAIGAPPYDTPAEARAQGEWAAIVAGEASPGQTTLERIKELVVAPRYGLGDIRSYIEGYGASDEHFDLGAVDLREEGLVFELPFFVIHGADDYVTPAKLARTYFDTITAPRSAFVLIPGGHTALIDHAEEFLSALNEHVRPLAHAPDESH
jgi:pimeloyl-ACP methyl ester carboxylesterase